MIGNLGTPELLLVLVIILLIFGVGRISKVAGELGGGIRAFRESLKGEKGENDKTTDSTGTEPKGE